MVTLSTYCLQTAPMWRLRGLLWTDKKPLVGLVVRVEKNPYTRDHTSKNEREFYYVNWMQTYGPASRWGNGGYRAKHSGYFLRNDLKFMRNDPNK